MKLNYTLLMLVWCMLCVGDGYALDEARSVTTLHEVTVHPLDRPVLHLTGYMREYSTLSSYTDTIFLYREKMVDFMLPSARAKEKGFRGWRTPRLLSSKSYYRFTDSQGLDSVSDYCNVHFSWSDWIELPRGLRLGDKVKNTPYACDTLRMPRRGIAQICRRNNDRLGIYLNLLNDTANRGWAQRLTGSRFQEREFSRLELDCMFEEVDADSVAPVQLTDYFFNVESLGRGYDLRFHGRRGPFIIQTIGELYITDKEYISLSGAKRIEKRKVSAADYAPVPPQRAIALPEGVDQLVARVESIDRDALRVKVVPDQRLAGFDDLFKTRHSAWEDFMSILRPPRYILNSTAMPSRW